MEPNAANFQQLQRQAQDLLSQLGQLHEGLAGQLAAARQQLGQADAQNKATTQELNAERQKLAATAQELAAMREKLTQTAQQLSASQQQFAQQSEQLSATRAALADVHVRNKGLEGKIAELTADNQSLQDLQLQWATEREGHLKARELADSKHAELNQQLRSLTDEHAKLTELHAGVTEQARKLAAEWNSRRQTQAAEGQSLRQELEQAAKALEASKQREKQWQGQVYKLQDDVRTLREETSRMTLTEEQSHHLISQLNAIIGFAEVLLDEAGSRATGEEREAFLHDIKESGTHLADYIHRLRGEKGENAPAEAAAPATPAASLPSADAAPRVILVAATDQAMRERIQGYVSKGGYEVAFAADADEALGLGANLQPLAIMIDNELPPKGAQDLIDALQREPRTRDIPVVIAGDDKQLYSLKVDRFDLLSKPINRGQLLQLMVKYDLLADRRRSTKMPTTVLVIDDDSRNTRLVKAMLKPYTVSVLVADGGAAGIKLAQKHRPDLIILDLMMPDVDGFQVIGALREDATTKQIPILVYTAKTITPEDRGRLGNVQTIIRKGELSKEQFMELVYKRGERRQQAAGAEAAA